MEYRTLGKSDVKVSEIILGCWAMGGSGYFGNLADRESIEAVRVSLELDVNTFDTAEIYGNGHSETVLGKALEGTDRDKCVISSKVFKHNMRRHLLIRACERSLRNLKTDYLDIYFLHYPVDDVPIGESMEAMLELRERGLIRAIGLSNFSLEQQKEAMRYGPVDVIQPCYSLLWRYHDKDLLPFCIENGIGVIPYSPLAQGLLTGKYGKSDVFTDGRRRAALFQPENYPRCLEVTEVLKAVSARHGKTPAQGAINWLLMTPGITAPIVGAKNPGQARENIGAVGWRFTDEEYAEIDEASRKFTDTLPRYALFFTDEIIEE